MPVSSYKPEMLELLRRAGNDESFEIHLPSRKDATHLCSRLNNLRREMRREHHTLVRVVEHVCIGIRMSTPTEAARTLENYLADCSEKRREELMEELRDRGSPSTLVVTPGRDDRFLPALHAAGVQVPTAEERLEEGTTSVAEVSDLPETSAEVLQRMFEEGEKE